MDGSNAGERKRRAALLSLLASIGLTALKVVAGALSGSLVLLSEGAHNAVDIAASGLTYLAVREADKPADAELKKATKTLHLCWCRLYVGCGRGRRRD